MSHLKLGDLFNMEAIGFASEAHHQYKRRFREVVFSMDWIHSHFNHHHHKRNWLQIYIRIVNTLRPYIERFTIDYNQFCMHAESSACFSQPAIVLFDLLFNDNNRSPTTNPLRELTIVTCRYHRKSFDVEKLFIDYPHLKTADYSNMRKLRLYNWTSSNNVRLNALLPHLSELEEIAVAAPLTPDDCTNLLGLTQLKCVSINCTSEQWLQPNGFAEKWAETNQLCALKLQSNQSRLAAAIIPSLLRMTNLRTFHFSTRFKSQFRNAIHEIGGHIEEMHLSETDCRLFDICAKCTKLKSLRMTLEDCNIYAEDDVNDKRNESAAIKVMSGLKYLRIDLAVSSFVCDEPVGLKRLYAMLKPSMDKIGCLRMTENVIHYQRCDDEQ